MLVKHYRPQIVRLLIVATLGLLTVISFASVAAARSNDPAPVPGIASDQSAAVFAILVVTSTPTPTAQPTATFAPTITPIGTPSPVVSYCPPVVSVTALNSWVGGNPPQYAFDCNVHTQWASGAHSDTITAKFARPLFFSGVQLSVAVFDGGSVQISVYGSADGGNWVGLAEGFGPVGPIPQPFKPIMAPHIVRFQYIRFTIGAYTEYPVISDVRLLLPTP